MSCRCSRAHSESVVPLTASPYAMPGRAPEIYTFPSRLFCLGSMLDTLPRRRRLRWKCKARLRRLEPHPLEDLALPGAKSTPRLSADSHSLPASSRSLVPSRASSLADDATVAKLGMRSLP